MRLNKDDKEAFVHAVMDDVPEIDYTEQANKLFADWLAPRLPEKLRAVYLDLKLRDALDNQYMYDSDNFPLIDGHQLCGSYAKGVVDVELTVKLNALRESSNEQHQSRNVLRTQIKSAINSCSTLKTAKERLPEFEKYLPFERDGTGVDNLPAISNIVAQLVAAGWPKDQAEAHAAGG